MLGADAAAETAHQIEDGVFERAAALTRNVRERELSEERARAAGEQAAHLALRSDRT